VRLQRQDFTVRRTTKNQRAQKTKQYSVSMPTVCTVNYFAFPIFLIIFSILAFRLCIHYVWCYCSY